MQDQNRRENAKLNSPDLTGFLNRMFRGDREAGDKAASLVEEELRKLAQYKLDIERPRPTFETRDLIQELYVRLFGSSTQIQFENRKCFYGLAADKMAQILIDRARNRKKREGDGSREDIDGVLDRFQDIHSADDLILINLALTELKQAKPMAAEVARLKFYLGFTLEETAETLELSISTVRRNLRLARRFLSERLVRRHGQVAL